ncbi:GntR family transcriptional regulator [Ancrocorticia populi]|uniref:GntR family transcriptional regulator n=1 Tax=Ancrocorticia populi TaxID=2175228 RepID=A0A2V1KCP6_9ACTO|nr:GntR family transcriptional regulator [Ancrocorticia populi]PWF27451.1 GntR family transcriptional regulator [Ancrocorticia populi]
MVVPSGPAMIVRDSTVPFHRQLKTILLEQISRDGLVEGDRLWSEPQISATYGVSRSVVRQTLAELENEGVIERVRGRGTFIAGAKMDHGLTISIEGLYAQAQSLGLELTSDVLQQAVEPAAEPVSTELEVVTGCPVFMLERVRGVEGMPWSHTASWIPSARVPGIEEHDFSTGSLYELLRTRYGMRFGRARRSIEAIAAPEEIAHYLGVDEGAPLLRIKSVLYDIHGIPIERFIAHHRGDMSRFDVSLGSMAGEDRLAEVYVAPGSSVG